jgi:hypothetical protein
MELHLNYLLEDVVHVSDVLELKDCSGLMPEPSWLTSPDGQFGYTSGSP